MPMEATAAADNNAAALEDFIDEFLGNLDELHIPYSASVRDELIASDYKEMRDFVTNLLAEHTDYIIENYRHKNVNTTKTNEYDIEEIEKKIEKILTSDNKIDILEYANITAGLLLDMKRRRKEYYTLRQHNMTTAKLSLKKGPPKRKHITISDNVQEKYGNEAVMANRKKQSIYWNDPKTQAFYAANPEKLGEFIRRGSQKTNTRRLLPNITAFTNKNNTNRVKNNRQTKRRKLNKNNKKNE